MSTSTKRATCAWTGRSGTEYEYHIFELPCAIDPGQDGNYIYAKKNSEGRWVPIYIGEGDLAERSGPAHHKGVCIRRKRATHFHCHLEARPADRRAEEADLLGRYANAYAPHGCNERHGG